MLYSLVRKSGFMCCNGWFYHYFVQIKVLFYIPYSFCQLTTKFWDHELDRKSSNSIWHFVLPTLTMYCILCFKTLRSKWNSVIANRTPVGSSCFIVRPLWFCCLVLQGFFKDLLTVNNPNISPQRVEEYVNGAVSYFWTTEPSLKKDECRTSFMYTFITQTNLSYYGYSSRTNHWVNLVYPPILSTVL